jgi:hypothetical protein
VRCTAVLVTLYLLQSTKYLSGTQFNGKEEEEKKNEKQKVKSLFILRWVSSLQRLEERKKERKKET